VAASYQEIEIPKMVAQVIQHDVHEAACRCGPAAPGSGPGRGGRSRHRHLRDQLQTWCVYLMDPGAPVRGADRGADRAKPSPGFVHGMLACAAAAVRHTNQLIRALIITASVISADEAPVRVGPGRRPTRSTCWSPARTC